MVWNIQNVPLPQFFICLWARRFCTIYRWRKAASPIKLLLHHETCVCVWSACPSLSLRGRLLGWDFYKQLFCKSTFNQHKQLSTIFVLQFLLFIQVLFIYFYPRFLSLISFSSCFGITHFDINNISPLYIYVYIISDLFYLSTL